jgi:hypothetical protein
VSGEPQRRLILHMSPRLKVHGLPEPQRFELVSSTVYTDGSTLQALHPTA